MRAELRDWPRQPRSSRVAALRRSPPSSRPRPPPRRSVSSTSPMRASTMPPRWRSSLGRRSRWHVIAGSTSPSVAATRPPPSHTGRRRSSSWMRATPLRSMPTSGGGAPSPGVPPPPRCAARSRRRSRPRRGASSRRRERRRSRSRCRGSCWATTPPRPRWPSASNGSALFGPPVTAPPQPPISNRFAPRPTRRWGSSRRCSPGSAPTMAASPRPRRLPISRSSSWVGGTAVSSRRSPARCAPRSPRSATTPPPPRGCSKNWTPMGR